VEGGYTLDRKPDQVSLLDVIEAIEGPLSSALPSTDGAAPYEEKLHKALDQITCMVRQQLEAIKLSDLLSPQQGSP
jgi:DNA-binding IscR family transcriptional regulator